MPELVEREVDVLVIGAGPAGLTAAYELARRGIGPTVLERESQVGGISRTVEYHGNRMDLGGHRFFSKSDAVMSWWLEIMPLQGSPSSDDVSLGRDVLLSDEPDAPVPEHEDIVMLSRSRLSRIYFLRRFFDYPISLSVATLRNLGLLRAVRIAVSYLGARVRQIAPERSLEDFLINRFGRELYSLFFRDYTEKVWGVPCAEIPPEWGAQRIKGVSMGKAILEALSRPFRQGGVDQKGTETSLISRFLYPKYGPGQLWSEVARLATESGATVTLGQEVIAIRVTDSQIESVSARDRATGRVSTFRPRTVFSTMPLADLIAVTEGDPTPPDVVEVAQGLPYRDFVTVGLLVPDLGPDAATRGREPLRDNWIYIQEPDVRLGRLQVFNNWSPYMVADTSNTWLGLEYFCDEGDDLWSLEDDEMVAFASAEAQSIGLLDAEAVSDSIVLRIQKAYPAYFGTYDRFDILREHLDGITNLYTIGRNGMHRYNNMDHSMMTAWAAVESLLDGAAKDRAWSVNAESEYHEEK